MAVYKVLNQDKSVNIAFCFEAKKMKYVLGVKGEEMFFEVIPLHKLYFDKSLSYLVLVLTYSTYCILYVKVIPLEC